MASSVGKRTSLAFPFLSMERLAMVMPIFSASSVTLIFLFASITSMFMIIDIYLKLNRQVVLGFYIYIQYIYYLGETRLKRSLLCFYEPIDASETAYSFLSPRKHIKSFLDSPYSRFRLLCSIEPENPIPSCTRRSAFPCFQCFWRS